MKYYECFQFNDKKEYCGHRYLAVPDNLKVNDYKNDKHEVVQAITKKEYDRQMPLYKYKVEAKV